MDNGLVTVITPAYNSEKYIEETILSVLNQTYTEWEMIIVDDCSKDSTCDIVRKYAEQDSRVKLLIQESNKGAGAARTRALRESNGRFIAYLDADDIWTEDKLEKQVRYMLDKNIGFSCTSYEVINDEGKKLNKVVRMLPKFDYKGFLTNNLLQTVGIMVDIEHIDRELLVMPNLRRRQDAATWLKVLKAGNCCYGMEEVLALYRRTENSLSSNKIKAAKGIWNLYRNVEKLPFFFACYCYVRYAMLAVWKRTYTKRK